MKMKLKKISLHKFVSILDGISFIYPAAKLLEINKVVKNEKLCYQIEILDPRTNLTKSYWIPVYIKEE